MTKVFVLFEEFLGKIVDIKCYKEEEVAKKEFVRRINVYLDKDFVTYGDAYRFLHASDSDDTENWFITLTDCPFFC